MRSAFDDGKKCGDRRFGECCLAAQRLRENRSRSACVAIDGHTLNVKAAPQITLVKDGSELVSGCGEG